MDSFTWDYYKKLKTFTNVLIVLKGVQMVDNALMLVEHGAPAIVSSNHAGSSLDTSPSAIEVAHEIHKRAPQVFNGTEVLTDGGVRCDSDVLKSMSLGVKVVSLGRPFYVCKFLWYQRSQACH